MGNCLAGESRTNNCKQIPGIAYTVIEPGLNERSLRSIIDAEVALDEDFRDVPSATVDPLVQRISEEIAEFREQLRRGQEQIQAMSTSVSSFDTTKSCPGLVELKQLELPQAKLIGVTIATQTEPLFISRLGETPNETSVDNNDTCHDLSEFMDAEDDLEDDNRYRLLRGGEALSVIEESEHEADLSPGALQRKMSAGRPKLIRMRNTTFEEPPPISEDDLKSDLDYLSAASSLSGSKNPSLYNSLERPLHVSQGGSNRNGDDNMSDTYSTVSGGNTTYGSLLSSPSSPTYLTPSQGSSSQETLTNHDGDKTPINYEELVEDGAESRPESVLSGNSSRNSNHKPKSSWQMLPIDNRQGGTTSIGVIPDEDQEHMRQYAYDVTLRSCNPDAAILSRKEWQTLHADLDQVDMEKFKKGFGQEDDTEEGGFCKVSPKTDLDEVAESYCEQFPFLAESIFEYLEATAQEKVESIDDLPELKKRFEELATTFRTDHDKLEGRCGIVSREHEHAKDKVCQIISSLKQTAQTMRSEKLSGDIREVCSSLENWVMEVELHTKSLDRAAQRIGRLDVVRRVFKMIEVMVLYVRILNTVCGNFEEERKLSRQILAERGIDFPSKSKTRTGNTQHLNNNNNHEKVGRCDYLISDDFSSSPSYESSGTHILQRLLGPKQSSEHCDSSLELILRQTKPNRNFLPRRVYEIYETILREFNWPWNSDQTWSGIRKTFAVLLMLFGVFLICRISFIPPCESAEPILSYGHNQPPHV